jgi:hypothetical protein
MTSIPQEALVRARSRLLRDPRELSGRVHRAIERTLARFQSEQPSKFVDTGYRTADAASYNSTEAAAAYLGAYGPRSILKYEEVLLWVLSGRTDNAKVSLIDFGCGPAVGFAAVLDVFSELREAGASLPTPSFLGIDREPAMLEVGADLARSLQMEFGTVSSADFALSGGSSRMSGDLLIVANVLNEGEGIEDPGPIAQELLSSGTVSDIIFMEPATERASRQLCKLASHTEAGWIHVGPCPSNGTACQTWTYREFAKRAYSFERSCLGRWAPAAYSCKYSMVRLSKGTPARPLGADEFVVISRRPDGVLHTCRWATEGPRATTAAAPWDVVRRDGASRSLWES